jgi:hypothetical protein
VQIFARQVRSLAERLNQAPDKNKLAFLDQLGINLLPAQSGACPGRLSGIDECGG